MALLENSPANAVTIAAKCIAVARLFEAIQHPVDKGDDARGHIVGPPADDSGHQPSGFGQPASSSTSWMGSRTRRSRMSVKRSKRKASAGHGASGSPGTEDARGPGARRIKYSASSASRKSDRLW